MIKLIAELKNGNTMNRVYYSGKFEELKRSMVFGKQIKSWHMLETRNGEVIREEGNRKE